MNWLQKNIWLVFVLGLLGSMVVFSTGIAIYAFQQDVQSVSDRPYEDGLRYEEELEAQRAARDLGFIPQYSFVLEGAQVVVHVELQKTGLELDGFELEAQRADKHSLDRKLRCQRSGKASFACTPFLPQTGYWDFYALARQGERKLINKQRVFASPRGTASP